MSNNPEPKNTDNTIMTNIAIMAATDVLDTSFVANWEARSPV